MLDKRVQVRHRSGSLVYFDYIGEALEYALTHDDVWKISFLVEQTRERIRFVRCQSGWKLEALIGHLKNKDGLIGDLNFLDKVNG